MQEVEVTLARLVSITWLFMWRGLVGALLIGAVVGFVIGFVTAALGGTSEHVSRAAFVAGMIVGPVWHVVVVKMALAKRYRDFRIALLAR